MKRLLIILLIILLAITSVGCGTIIDRIRDNVGERPDEETTVTTTDEVTTTSVAETEMTEPAPQDVEDEPYVEPIVEGAPLVHHFEFKNNLNDSLPTGAVLGVHDNTGNTNFSDDAWSWHASEHPGGGLILQTDQITDPENYSIGFSISFNDVGPSWKKILSFREASVDGGFYFYNGQLQLYPFNVNENITYTPNTYYDFILSRNVDKLMTVHVVQSDGSITKVYEELDQNDESVPIAVDGLYQFVFFTDDNATSSEWTTGGSVRSIRVWNGPVDQIRFG